MAIINYIEKHLKTFTVKTHKHNYWEIIYVTDGVGTIKTEDNHVIEYKKGETICIPPNVQHVNISSIGFKNIHLTIEDWDPQLQTPTLIPASDTSKDLYTLLNFAYRYFHQVSPENAINLSLTNTIVSFLNHLLKQSDSYKITQALVNEIINHYTEYDFDLEQAYALIPLSKEHIRKLFIKEHGISPVQYLKRRRLELAKQLLAQKDDGYLRINEIAETCGFADSAYFSRIFKKETGISPNEYQLKLLENNKIYPPSTINTAH